MDEYDPFQPTGEEDIPLPPMPAVKKSSTRRSDKTKLASLDMIKLPPEQALTVGIPPVTGVPPVKSDSSVPSPVLPPSLLAAPVPPVARPPLVSEHDKIDNHSKTVPKPIATPQVQSAASIKPQKKAATLIALATAKSAQQNQPAKKFMYNAGSGKSPMGHHAYATQKQESKSLSRISFAIKPRFKPISAFSDETDNETAVTDTVDSSSSVNTEIEKSSAKIEAMEITDKKIGDMENVSSDKLEKLTLASAVTIARKTAAELVSTKIEKNTGKKQDDVKIGDQKDLIQPQLVQKDHSDNHGRRDRSRRDKQKSSSHDEREKSKDKNEFQRRTDKDSIVSVKEKGKRDEFSHKKKDTKYSDSSGPNKTEMEEILPLRKDSHKEHKVHKQSKEYHEKGKLDALEKEKPCLYSPSQPTETKFGSPRAAVGFIQKEIVVGIKNDHEQNQTTKISKPEISMVPKQVLKPNVSKGLSFVAEAFGDVEKKIQQELSVKDVGYKESGVKKIKLKRSKWDKTEKQTEDKKSNEQHASAISMKIQESVPSKTPAVIEEMKELRIVNEKERTESIKSQVKEEPTKSTSIEKEKPAAKKASTEEQEGNSSSDSSSDDEESSSSSGSSSGSESGDEESSDTGGEKGKQDEKETESNLKTSQVEKILERKPGKFKEDEAMGVVANDSSSKSHEVSSQGATVMSSHQIPSTEKSFQQQPGKESTPPTSVKCDRQDVRDPKEKQVTPKSSSISDDQSGQPISSSRHSYETQVVSSSSRSHSHDTSQSGREKKMDSRSDRKSEKDGKDRRSDKRSPSQDRRRRSTSRERRRRSISRDTHHSTHSTGRDRKRHSRERSRSYDRDRRGRSRENKRSRERRSKSRELRSRDRRSKSGERRSRSINRRSRSPNRRSRTPARRSRSPVRRSRSRGRRSRSRDRRSRERRSRSRDRRSRSRERRRYPLDRHRRVSPERRSPDRYRDHERDRDRYDRDRNDRDRSDRRHIRHGSPSYDRSRRRGSPIRDRDHDSRRHSPGREHDSRRYRVQRSTSRDRDKEHSSKNSGKADVVESIPLPAVGIPLPGSMYAPFDTDELPPPPPPPPGAFPIELFNEKEIETVEMEDSPINMYGVGTMPGHQNTTNMGAASNLGGGVENVQSISVVGSVNSNNNVTKSNAAGIVGKFPTKLQESHKPLSFSLGIKKPFMPKKKALDIFDDDDSTGSSNPDEHRVIHLPKMDLSPTMQSPSTDDTNLIKVPLVEEKIVKDIVKPMTVRDSAAQLQSTTGVEQWKEQLAKPQASQQPASAISEVTSHIPTIIGGRKHLTSRIHSDVPSTDSESPSQSSNIEITTPEVQPVVQSVSPALKTLTPVTLQESTLPSIDVLIPPPKPQRVVSEDGIIAETPQSVPAPMRHTIHPSLLGSAAELGKPLPTRKRRRFRFYENDDNQKQDSSSSMTVISTVNDTTELTQPDAFGKVELKGNEIETEKLLPPPPDFILAGNQSEAVKSGSNLIVPHEGGSVLATSSPAIDKKATEVLQLEQTAKTTEYSSESMDRKTQASSYDLSEVSADKVNDRIKEMQGEPIGRESPSNFNLCMGSVDEEPMIDDFTVDEPSTEITYESITDEPDNKQKLDDSSVCQVDNNDVKQTEQNEDIKAGKRTTRRRSSRKLQLDVSESDNNIGSDNGMPTRRRSTRIKELQKENGDGDQKTKEEGKENKTKGKRGRKKLKDDETPITPPVTEITEQPALSIQENVENLPLPPPPPPPAPEDNAVTVKPETATFSAELSSENVTSATSASAVTIKQVTASKKEFILPENIPRRGEEVMALSSLSGTEVLSSGLGMSPGSSVVKPEKVKSRWRRWSELEGIAEAKLEGDISKDDTGPPPPPPPPVAPPTSNTTSLSAGTNEVDAVHAATTIIPGLDNLPLPPVKEDNEIAVQVENQQQTLVDISQVKDEKLIDGQVEDIPPPPPSVDVKVEVGVELKAEAEIKDEVPVQKEEIKIPDKPPYFEQIMDNIFLCERKKSKARKEAKRMVCDCTLPTKEDRVFGGAEACGEDCLNRMLMIECGSRCPCNDQCTNKRFQRHQYGGVSPYFAGSKGWGLKADVDLPAGSFVMEYVGEVLDFAEFQRRAKSYDKNQHFYFMALNADEIVDATYKGNVSRFINHSCDPTAETQKWTVNGQLRIGFFTVKPVPAGEEITFDYQFENYGEEAQKCYCGSVKCRGFLGTKKTRLHQTVFEEDEGTDSGEVQEGQRKRKKEKKKRVFDDILLSEEIEEMLQLDGMRRREHVLELARLMVRAESTEHRMSLIKVLQATKEPNCLRLFLDYQGLPLIWSWMVDVPRDAIDLKMQLLDVLKLLPINNKTILKDSKILSMVQKWSSLMLEGKKDDSQEDGSTTPRSSKGDTAEESAPGTPSTPVTPGLSYEGTFIHKKRRLLQSLHQEEASGSDSDVSESKGKEVEGEPLEGLSSGLDTSQDGSEMGQGEASKEISSQICDFASSLLSSWKDLKEIFKIPKIKAEERKKRERELDQREKDRGYTKDDNTIKQSRWDTRKRHGGSPDRPKDEKRRREPERESSLDARIRKLTAPTPPKGPKMSKEEHRKLFELQIKAEDMVKKQAELEQQQQLELQQQYYQQQQTQDPNYSTFYQQPQTATGYPDVGTTVYQEPTPYDTPTTPTTATYDPITGTYTQPATPAQSQYILQADGTYIQASVAQPAVTVDPATQQPVQVYPGTTAAAYVDPNTQQIVQTYQQPYTQQPTATAVTQSQQAAYVQPQQQQVIQTVPGQQVQQVYYTPQGHQVIVQQPVVQQVQQPAQIVQQLPGQQTQVITLSDPATIQQLDRATKILAINEQLALLDPMGTNDVTSTTLTVTRDPREPPPPPPSPPPKPKTVRLPPNWKTAKDGDGKTYYYHTVTRQTQWDPPAWDQGESDDDQMDLGTPTYDEHEPKKKQKGKNAKAKKKKETTSTAADSSEIAKKIKDQFRTKMSKYMVKYLTPYRKPECKMGRITSTEDFKHLARKLTHAVLDKELKYCRHVEDLEVNESVKSKAKDFVKKYMGRFSSVYKGKGDESPD